jgi:FkbM family methyltransferase
MPDRPNHLLTRRDRRGFCQLRKLGVNINSLFDIGASNGCWSHRVSADFPEARFDLFEPLVDEIPQYRQKLDVYLAEHAGFHLHQIALGAECKTATMHITPNAVGSTALDMNGFSPAEWRKFDVEMLTLDAAIDRFGLPVPQAIKIDTQGCELQILRGAEQTLPQVELLLLECWLARSYGGATPLWLEVADWLNARDFHLWDVGYGWRAPDGTLVSQDCFFLNRRSAASRLHNEPSPSARAARHLNESHDLLVRVRDILSARGTPGLRPDLKEPSSSRTIAAG